MKNRLKELRLNKGLTLKQVADAIGVSEATAQRYETGRISSLKYEKAEALAKLYNVSPGYLMGWAYDFESFDGTPDGWTEQDQRFLFDMVQKHGETSLDEYLKSHSHTSLYEAAAGEGRKTDWYSSDEVMFVPPADAIAVRVVGRSMEPTLLDGDIVFVRPQKTVEHRRQICLVKINGDEATIKRVDIKEDGILLYADNVDVYPPHFYTAREAKELPVNVEGIVVQLYREID